MEFPSQYPDSPLPSQHGPSRSRLDSRSNRLSSATPYQRKQQQQQRASNIHQQQSNSNINSNQSTAPTSASSGFFNSLRKTISKPLSWLSSSGNGNQLDDSSPSSELNPNLGLPSSSSSNTISSLSRRRAIAQAQSKATQEGKKSPNQIIGVGSKLVTGLVGGNLIDSLDEEGRRRIDLESYADPDINRSSGYLVGSKREYQRGNLLPPPSSSSNHQRLTTSISTPGSFPNSNQVRSGRSNLILDQRDTSMELERGEGAWGGAAAADSTMRSPSPAISNASAAIEAAGRLRISRTSQFRRSNSLRPGDSLSEYGGDSSPSSSSRIPPVSFNFGSERRFLTPSKLNSSASVGNFNSGGFSGSPLNRTQQTHYTLPSKSPLSRQPNRGRSSLGLTNSNQYSASEVGGFVSKPPPPGNYTYAASSIGGASNSSRSRAGSVAFGGGAAGGSFIGGNSPRRTSQFGGSTTIGRNAKRREWSSLGLQPTKTPQSHAEKLMKEYDSLNNGIGAAKALEMNVKQLGRSGTPSSLGKRGNSVLDYDDEDELVSPLKSSRK